jgi:hypothetical protein
MASENELPVFDAKATDFTKNIQQRTAGNSKRDMRYSQRNYGNYRRNREYGDFGNRFNQDPNENVFSSSNSHVNDRLKFLNRKRDNSRPRTGGDSMALPVKKKNSRARAKTPKKLVMAKDSDSESKGDQKSKNGKKIKK